MRSQVEPKHIIIIVGLLILFGIGFGYYAFMQKDPASDTNQQLEAVRLRILTAGTAMRMYSIDNDSRLPLAEEWMDRVGPYSQILKEGESRISERQIFQDPSNLEADYGFAMNSNVSGIAGYAIENYNILVIIFTSNVSARNAAGTEKMLRCELTPPGSELKYGYGITIQPMPLPARCEGTNGFSFVPVMKQ